jgi:hypothetical protein
MIRYPDGIYLIFGRDFGVLRCEYALRMSILVLKMFTLTIIFIEVTLLSHGIVSSQDILGSTMLTCERSESYHFHSSLDRELDHQFSLSISPALLPVQKLLQTLPQG